jgi:hypothetical protein
MAAASRFEALQSDIRSSQLVLTFAPPGRSNALALHLQSLKSQITAQLSAVGQTQDSLSAAESHPRHPFQM